MGFALLPETKRKFKWKELHGKFLKIAVAEPNPECLEPGQVYGFDPETGVTYVLHEYGPEGEACSSKDGGER